MMRTNPGTDTKDMSGFIRIQFPIVQMQMKPNWSQIDKSDCFILFII